MQLQHICFSSIYSTCWVKAPTCNCGVAMTMAQYEGRNVCRPLGNDSIWRLVSLFTLHSCCLSTFDIAHMCQKSPIIKSGAIYVAYYRIMAKIKEFFFQIWFYDFLNLTFCQSSDFLKHFSNDIFICLVGHRKQHSKITWTQKFQQNTYNRK